MVKNFCKKIFFLMTIYSLSIFSQVREIDSVNSINYEVIVSNLQKYEIVFKNNLNNAQNNNYEQGIAKSFSKLALIFYLKGEYDKSTEYHLNAIALFQKLNMSDELAEEYAELGYQMKLLNLKKSNEYMQQAISIAERNKLQPFRISKIYDNYGVIKEMQEQYDSAQYFYLKAFNIKKTLDDSIGIPYSLNKLAVLKAKQNNFSEAYRYLNISDEYRSKEPEDFGRIENLSLHADFLAMQNFTNQAIEKYQEVYNSAKSINYTYLMLYSLEKLSELFRKKEDFKNALASFQLYESLKDSLYSIDIKTRIAQLENAYETEQKNKQLAESQYLLRLTEQQLFFAIVTVLLLTLIFIGIYKYLTLRKKRDIAELEYNVRIKSALLEKQITDEKLKISRELHDNIGSQLTFIISSLDNIIFKSPNSNDIRILNSLKEFTRNALNDLRSTIWAMKQQEGDSEHLVLKVTEFISKLNETLTEIKFVLKNNLSKKFKLTSVQILNLFRIIQEAVQNSIKHSNAKEVSVSFEDNSDGFGIIIKDNGTGFDPQNLKGGYGLSNMQKRSQEAGGIFEIKTNNNGTEIICRLNLSE